ncbi:MAG: VWA domain-containing protein [Planctomycetota bacterium]
MGQGVWADQELLDQKLLVKEGQSRMITAMYRNRSIIILIKLIVLSCLLHTTGTSVLADPVSDWSSAVLSTKDTDEKERLVCVKGHHGVLPETLSKLAKRERHGPAVASAAGQYFENGEFDRNTPDLLRLLADRPDIGHQAIAYASLSPIASQLIMGFADSKSVPDQQIAARMIAASSVMRFGSDFKNQTPAEDIDRPINTLSVTYHEQIKKLLTNSQDRIVLEYTLLAAGHERLAMLKQLFNKHAGSRDARVAMAAQYALARTKSEVNQPVLLRQLNAAPKHHKDRPVIGYDPRDTPMIYAIRALGETKHNEAVSKLLDLIANQDTHVAVAAARAVGQIGGEGIGLRLLDALNAQTPWPVRVAIYDAIGRHPDKATIARLRVQYSQEKGRFRQDLLYALFSIVAGKPRELTIEAFDEWWAQNQDTYQADKQATMAWRKRVGIRRMEVSAIAGFYESAVISNRPVFVVDASLSMKGAQIDSLKQELATIVKSFPVEVRFNIVDFGGHVRTLAPGGMIPAKNRKAAMQQFDYEMELTFGTRVYDAIERASRIPGMDTIHFLSDGAPLGSDLKAWERVNYVSRLQFRTAPVAVHIVYYPNPGQPKNAKLAQAMSKYVANHIGRFKVSTIKADARE